MTAIGGTEDPAGAKTSAKAGAAGATASASTSRKRGAAAHAISDSDVRMGYFNYFFTTVWRRHTC